MTDLVERLRASDAWQDASVLMDEAADEIERLRDHMRALADTSVDRDTAGIFKGLWHGSEKECDELRAEVERLRAALQNLTHDPPPSLAREPDTDCEVVLKMREIARRALEPKP